MVVVTRRAGAAAQSVPIPAAVVVAVQEGIARVVVAVALLVDVGLLEGEIALARELPIGLGGAVGRVRAKRSRRWGTEALSRCAGPEERGTVGGGGAQGRAGQDRSQERHAGQARCESPF